MLRAHRLYELFNEYGLFNIEISDPVLEATFSNQILMSYVDRSLPSVVQRYADPPMSNSEDVYDAETLLVFMHDL